MTCAVGPIGNGVTFMVPIAVTVGGTPRILPDPVEAMHVSEFDPDFGNNSAQEETIVQSDATPEADLDLTISDTPDPQIVSTTISYDLTVTNDGGDVAIDVQLTGAFTGPPVTVDSITSSAGALTCIGTAIDCDLGDLDIGDSVVITVEVTPSADGVLTLTASAQSAGPLAVPDPNSADNIDIVETTSVGVATFTVTKTADTNDGTCDADCSLREAITAANASAGLDIIEFSIGTGVATITPLSALPVILDPVVIDATDGASRIIVE